MELIEHPDRMGYWRWTWLYWLATLRLSNYAVCTMSKNKGHIDYHDYKDSVEKFPDHFAVMKCERCGKEFTI